MDGYTKQMDERMTDHKTTLRIPPDLHKAARIKAIEMDTNLSSVVRQFLRQWVDGEIDLQPSSGRRGPGKTSRTP